MDSVNLVYPHVLASEDCYKGCRQFANAVVQTGEVQDSQNGSFRYVDIPNANIGYTDKHQAPYAKSDKGKTIGTAVGITMGLFEYGHLSLKDIKDCFKWIKEGFVTPWYNQLPPELARPNYLGGVTSSHSSSPKLAKFKNLCNKSRILRAGLVGVLLAAPFIVWGGLGRLLGSCCDKVTNKHTSHKIDKQIEAKQNNIHA